MRMHSFSRCRITEVYCVRINGDNFEMVNKLEISPSLSTITKTPTKLKYSALFPVSEVMAAEIADIDLILQRIANMFKLAEPPIHDTCILVLSVIWMLIVRSWCIFQLNISQMTVYATRHMK